MSKFLELYSTPGEPSPLAAEYEAATAQVLHLQDLPGGALGIGLVPLASTPITAAYTSHRQSLYGNAVYARHESRVNDSPQLYCSLLTHNRVAVHTADYFQQPVATTTAALTGAKATIVTDALGHVALQREGAPDLSGTISSNSKPFFLYAEVVTRALGGSLVAIMSGYRAGFSVLPDPASGFGLEPGIGSPNSGCGVTVPISFDLSPGTTVASGESRYIGYIAGMPSNVLAVHVMITPAEVTCTITMAAGAGADSVVTRVVNGFTCRMIARVSRVGSFNMHLLDAFSYETITGQMLRTRSIETLHNALKWLNCSHVISSGADFLSGALPTEYYDEMRDAIVNYMQEMGIADPLTTYGPVPLPYKLLTRPTLADEFCVAFEVAYSKADAESSQPEKDIRPWFVGLYTSVGNVRDALTDRLADTGVAPSAEQVDALVELTNNASEVLHYVCTPDEFQPGRPSDTLHRLWATNEAIVDTPGATIQDAVEGYFGNYVWGEGNYPNAPVVNALTDMPFIRDYCTICDLEPFSPNATWAAIWPAWLEDQWLDDKSAVSIYYDSDIGKLRIRSFDFPVVSDYITNETDMLMLLAIRRCPLNVYESLSFGNPSPTTMLNDYPLIFADYAGVIPPTYASLADHMETLNPGGVATDRSFAIINLMSETNPGKLFYGSGIILPFVIPDVDPGETFYMFPERILRTESVSTQFSSNLRGYGRLCLRSMPNIVENS